MLLQTQIEELEEKRDNLNQDFVSLSKQSVELSESVRSLESEIAAQTDAAKSAIESSADSSHITQLIRGTYSKLNASRAQLAQATIAKSEKSKRLQAYSKEVADKKNQLEFHKARPAEEREKQSRRKLESAMGNKQRKSK